MKNRWIKLNPDKTKVMLLCKGKHIEDLHLFMIGNSHSFHSWMEIRGPLWLLSICFQKCIISSLSCPFPPRWELGQYGQYIKHLQTGLPCFTASEKKSKSVKSTCFNILLPIVFSDVTPRSISTLYLVAGSSTALHVAWSWFWKHLLMY